MVGTHRYESQAPAAPEVGCGVRSQTLRAVLQTWALSALPLYHTQKQPVTGTVCVPERPFVGAEGSVKRPTTRERRFLGQYGEHVEGGAMINVAYPYLRGRPEDGTEGAWLEAM